MQEYVFTISLIDSERPLKDDIIFEFGVSKDNQKAFVESMIAVTELLKLLKTPEKVAKFIKDNESVASLKATELKV